MPKVHLKPVVTKIEEVPEAYRDLYDQSGDSFVLTGFDEKDFKTRLDEFRNNNIGLQKKQAELAAQLDKYKDVDPVKYAAALDAQKKLDALEDKNLMDEGKVEELINKRTENMRKDHDARINALQGTLKSREEGYTKYRQTVRQLKVKQAVRDAITKVGVPKTTALTHIDNLAEKQWDLDDKDELVPVDVYDDTGKPIKMDDWAARLVKDSPYFFEESRGGGGQGGQPRNQQRQGAGAPKTLNNPSADVFGKHLKDIASGAVDVVIGD